jgi:hypothetical protein
MQRQRTAGIESEGFTGGLGSGRGCLHFFYCSNMISYFAPNLSRARRMNLDRGPVSSLRSRFAIRDMTPSARPQVRDYLDARKVTTIVELVCRGMGTWSPAAR